MNNPQTLPLPTALGVLAACSASSASSSGPPSSSPGTSSASVRQLLDESLKSSHEGSSSTTATSSSLAEHQVLEALTRLRSSSAGTPTNAPSTTPAKIPIAHLLEATSITNTNTKSTSKTKKTAKIRKPKRPPPSLPKSFPCPSCTKCFTRKSNLDSHLITHSQDKPHRCSACGKAFARLSDRTRHLTTTHGPARVYQCRGSVAIKNINTTNEWGCGHYYSRADGLRKHFRSHAGRHCLLAFSAGNPHIKVDTSDETALDDPKLVELAVLNVRKHCGW